jgi:hypothetical protein
MTQFYFYLYICLLSCFIVIMAYYNTYNAQLYKNIKDTFQTKDSKASVILLGDSILKNNSYVGNNQSVEHLLKAKSEDNCYNYAEDGAIIVDCYTQLDNINDTLNNANTTIYLSVGGNDIISYYIEQLNSTKNTHVLIQMFNSYKKLVKSIQTKMNLAKLVLLDIYYPAEPYYKQYYGLISKWNTMINQFASNPPNNISSVLEVSKILNNNKDFVFAVEPSEIGGGKIVNLMING